MKNITKKFENIPSNFEGTIIDIETDGKFCDEFQNDSRYYKYHKPIIFGFINKNGLSILCAENEESIEMLKNEINELLEKLERPFHAFNCDFERGVFFYNLNKKIIFEKELNIKKYEAKREVVPLLEIPQYGDPFYDDGKACMDALLKGEINRPIAHNRSCLLKERDILLKRGFRKPDPLNYINA